ncbi:unnamed protein product, partial [Mesorhabditis belari]|uniref:Pre-mRNA-splicing factor ISY1 n=1 Tax=Mesorhabditis belari TaxID=2138241 RepID=A0AAF3F1X1_9BILA
MARNAEKAMTALARWRRMKEDEERGPIAKRPHDTRECRNLQDAIRFRNELAKDIAKKIATIQNPGLGEFKIRDLNDEINKAIKHKNSWEKRIQELGGTDFRKMGRELDKEGRSVGGDHSYKYFGAAKDLPGVRELFEKDGEIEKIRKTRVELMKYVDASYYGYLDDDDGILEPLEKEEETRAMEKAKKEWDVTKVKWDKDVNDSDSDGADDDIYKVEDDPESDWHVKITEILGEDGRKMAIRHVMVPTLKDVEEALLESKKQQMLEKYLGEGTSS